LPEQGLTEDDVIVFSFSTMAASDFASVEELVRRETSLLTTYRSEST